MRQKSRENEINDLEPSIRKRKYEILRYVVNCMIIKEVIGLNTNFTPTYANMKYAVNLLTFYNHPNPYFL